MKSNDAELLPLDQIVPSIFTVRGRLVLLDSDLAAFHGLSTKLLRQQLKRKLACFPEDFMFQLSAEDVQTLAGEFVTLDPSDDGLPYALTEHCAFIAGMLLDTPRSMDIGAQVVRAFVQVRSEMSHVLASRQGLALRVVQLQRRIESHDFIVGLLQTFCDIMKAPGALHLTDSQRAELDRRLDEYERSRDGG